MNIRERLYDRFLKFDEPLLSLYLKDKKKCFEQIVDNIFVIEKDSFSINDPIELMSCILDYSRKRDVLNCHCPTVIYEEFEDYLWDIIEE